MVDLRQLAPKAGTQHARPPLGAAPRTAPDGIPMTREGWTNIAIPAELAADIKRLHVPDRAKSVQAYVTFWARLGCIVDTALADSEASDVAGRIIDALKAMEKRA
jgi:hypothetical protein